MTGVQTCALPISAEFKDLITFMTIYHTSNTEAGYENQEVYSKEIFSQD